MESFFKETEAPFLNSRPQRPLHLDLLPLFLPDLLYPSHQNPPSTLPQGIKAGQSVAIDDPDGAFTNTAFDANHCPALDHSLAEVRSCSDFGQIKNPSLSPSILDPKAKALSDTETKQWRIKLSLFHSTREERRVEWWMWRKAI
ncbi:hypothetical protein RchiOBHm_Chr6g0289691 [Rosa chinensis]|uniref:Uncharacterized protein n=1 Tax=Rosa chinensis TaxID=74649 RepID=A0A2P6PVP4_ROSCH|nr:hypothetical protein RchiOBHm_Chr6g0289691 [Rosa chinensis]